MPLIRAYNTGLDLTHFIADLPRFFSVILPHRRRLTDALREAAMRVLGFTENSKVTVVIGPDEEVKDGPVIVEVALLFTTEERNLKLRERLAEELGRATEKALPPTIVEVAICRFDQVREAFWTNENDEDGGER